jgi:hypothetical protein
MVIVKQVSAAGKETNKEGDDPAPNWLVGNTLPVFAATFALPMLTFAYLLISPSIANSITVYFGVIALVLIVIVATVVVGPMFGPTLDKGARFLLFAVMNLIVDLVIVAGVRFMLTTSS